MYKKRYHLKSGMRKFSIALLSGVMAVSLGLAAACTTDDDDSSSGESTSSSTDKQTILNGNFEFFGDSEDKTHIIYTPDSWSASTPGRTNYVMNGIIDTSEYGWGRISDPELASKLEYNDELDEDDDNYEDEYVDYNGMRVRDIPYANPHAALETDASDEDKALIENPLTHDIVVKGEGDNKSYAYIDEDGNEQPLYMDEDGNFFTDEKKETPYESHVLMIHNYVNDDARYGTAQAYTSSTTLTLEPNTAAEISVWVKTSDLMFDKDGAVPAEELGAYIAIEQTVGGNEVDTFYINAINTELLNSDENNGWVEYTIFVQGCDFASSTITVELGLGRADDDGDYAEVLEGYAFFDDVKATVYPDMSECENYNTADEEGLLENTTCTLTDKDEFKEFSFDDHKNDNYYYIDLSSRQARLDNALNADTVAASLTEDADYYVTSSSTNDFYGVHKKTADEVGTTYTNHNLDIATTNDVVAAFNLADLANELKAASDSKYGGVSKYSATLNEVLGNAAELPGAKDVDGNVGGTALMILSSRGAAYTAEIEGTDKVVDGETVNSFTVANGGYMIVSFWVKTSDMDGFTASTISLYDEADEDTVATLSVDTTDVTFDVGEEKDIYNGWVQCFFFVENPLETEKTFKMDFSFGNSTIKDTSASAYKSGYAAIANIQTFTVDKEVFDLASTGSYAASFSFQSTDNRSNNYMDDVYGALNNNIENNISRPSSYNGVNGASASVVYKEELDTEGYDKRNSNESAGLINKDYFGNYLEAAENDTENKFTWLEDLLEGKYTISEALGKAEAVWNELFGTETIQPLLIVNTIRQFNDGTTAAMNYGFIASSNTTVASASYQAITVRVKVSKGAVAYVYLTDRDNRTEVSSFSLPGYSFWYDSMGNVLDSEPDYEDDSYNSRDHIVYYLRDDGLYEDKNGKLFANLYNYARTYYDESASHYTADGELVLFEDLDDDEIYYVSEAEAAKKGQQSPHYLVATNTDGSTTRVFNYFDGAYHYIITETDDDGDSTVSYSEPVSAFVTGSENGGADLRYNNTDTDKQLVAVIDRRYDENGKLFGIDGTDYSAASVSGFDTSELGYDENGNYTSDGWQTVTFFIHTGDESVNYVLELWSGARDTSGVEADGDNFRVSADGSVAGSYVMFDYSNLTVDEETYAGLTSEYSNNIIDKYIALFKAEGLLSENLIATSGKNIAYYEGLFDKFVEEGKLEESDRPADYEAMYYTYSLYDDAGYVPFNADTASEGETGYDYSADDYSETLVYLSYRDYANNSVNVFVDYSATAVTVESGTSDDTTDDDEETTENNTNVWLLVASIILAVVLIFTLLSMFIRDLLKKRRRTRKFTNRNVYSGKRKHYIRKLGLTETAPEADGATEGAEANGESAEEPATEPEAENTPDGEPAEEEVPAEHIAEDVSEEPAEENESSEAESQDKPEGEDK